VCLLQVIWLKIVYTRYDVSAALPVEYGTVQARAATADTPTHPPSALDLSPPACRMMWSHVSQACSYLAGIVFFQEHKVMAGWQLAVGLSGLAVILAGVAFSARQTVPCAKRVRRAKPTRVLPSTGVSSTIAQ
jgi:hypothetical protein